MLPPQALLEDPTFQPATRPWIRHDLQALGLQAGDIVMVHVRLSAFRYVIGGVDTVVSALLDTIGTHGTLLVFTGWEGEPLPVPLPPQWQTAYREHALPFDPACSAAQRAYGCFPERVRTWPGTQRSAHPEASFAALGSRASWLIGPMDATSDPWGADSVLGRLVHADGKVLLLGAPLKTLTVCHHAEAIAKVPRKRFRTSTVPVLVDGQVQWKDYCTLDTFYGALPYWDDPTLQIDSAIGTLAQQAVAAHTGHAGMVTHAPSWIFSAKHTVAAVCAWLEATFGE